MQIYKTELLLNSRMACGSGRANSFEASGATRGKQDDLQQSREVKGRRDTDRFKVLHGKQDLKVDRQISRECLDLVLERNKQSSSLGGLEPPTSRLTAERAVKTNYFSLCC